MKKFFSKIADTIRNHPAAYWVITGLIVGEMLGQIDSVERYKNEVVKDYFDNKEEK